ncbi:hypothetical protein [Candidatus Pelagibacter communis]|uniref:hypothetical protein n=1 Tax=Pelagibacter ubique TaxID=198252 RepID=UPI0009E29B75|nr:hypothetical protein [Candidatus Pelagibacter ubique]
MKNNKFIFENNIYPKYLNKKLSNKFYKKYFKIEKEVTAQIDEPENVYNILSKKFRLSFKIKDLQKFKKYKNIAIIGMGGSVLGSHAIFKFLEKKIKKNLFFFDNIDYEKALDFKQQINKKSVLFIVISKSGNTIETISNFFFINKIKKNQKNLILISEKKNNALFEISKKYNLFHVEHKHYIGGRYSVLSEVGILPAYLMGINIFSLRKNLKNFYLSIKGSFLKESSVKVANIVCHKKLKSLIFLNYSPRLEKFLYWCQQLIAESLGKKGKGLMPVISSAPKDHHSALQLYLDGPKDKLFHIFSLDENVRKKIKIKKVSKYIDYLHNKDLIEIRNAQKEALIKTFKKNKIPFRELKIKKYDEETLSQLFSYFILEISIVGKILGINPFDQPAVEQVKKITKINLS